MIFTIEALECGNSTLMVEISGVKFDYKNDIDISAPYFTSINHFNEWHAERKKTNVGRKQLQIFNRFIKKVINSNS